MDVEFANRQAKWELWITNSIDIVNEFSIQALVSNKVVELEDQYEQLALMAAETYILDLLRNKKPTT